MLRFQAGRLERDRGEVCVGGTQLLLEADKTKLQATGTTICAQLWSILIAGKEASLRASRLMTRAAHSSNYDSNEVSPTPTNGSMRNEPPLM
jgi:hypothetical protein